MNKPVAIFSLLMSVLFVVLGVLIAIEPSGLFASLPGYTHYFFSFILILYGIFRFYRAYKVLGKKD